MARNVWMSGESLSRLCDSHVVAIGTASWEWEMPHRWRIDEAIPTTSSRVARSRARRRRAVIRVFGALVDLRDG